MHTTFLTLTGALSLKMDLACGIALYNLHAIGILHLISGMMVASNDVMRIDRRNNCLEVKFSLIGRFKKTS